MGKALRYYEAVYTDSGTCLIGCGHKHQNIVTATACISHAGGYVVGVNRWGKFRELSDREEAEFQKAMRGHGKPRIKVPAWLLPTSKTI
jgi:hypothetical protein